MPAKKKRYCYDYARPMVTVDCVVLRAHRRSLDVALIRRARTPHQGRWALPGGFIRMNEPARLSPLFTTVKLRYISPSS